MSSLNDNSTQKSQMLFDITIRGASLEDLRTLFGSPGGPPAARAPAAAGWGPQSIPLYHLKCYMINPETCRRLSPLIPTKLVSIIPLACCQD
jgi:hypothetical protein